VLVGCGRAVVHTSPSTSLVVMHDPSTAHVSMVGKLSSNCISRKQSIQLGISTNNLFVILKYSSGQDNSLRRKMMPFNPKIVDESMCKRNF
jgi:hypothetical protein